MDYRIVSQKIAHDGHGFSCRICGRAGYSSMARIKGHLSQCPGREIRAPAEPQVPESHLGLAGTMGSTALPVQTQLVGQAASWSRSYAPAHESQLVSELTQRVLKLENEYVHGLEERALATRSSFGGSDWFSRNKPIVIVGVIMLAFLFLSNQSRSCPSVCGSGTKGLTAKSLMERGVTKIADKAMTKTVDKLLG